MPAENRGKICFVAKRSSPNPLRLTRGKTPFFLAGGALPVCVRVCRGWSRDQRCGAMFAEEIRRAVEAASRERLPVVAALMWGAFEQGQVSEAEAEALSGLIEARQLSGTICSSGQNSDAAETNDEAARPSERRARPKSRRGSRPRTDASMGRRRRWAASGRLPPALAAQFTLAEQAVLALVAAETVQHKDCRLAIGHLAAIAGVAETTVRNAIREARKLGMVTVEERRVTHFRNQTNVVRIISTEWTSWLRLARKSASPSAARDADRSSARGGGCKSAKCTNTHVLHPVNSAPLKPRKGCRKRANDPVDTTSRGTPQLGRTGRAMR